MRISDWSSDVCSSDLGNSSLRIGIQRNVVEGRRPSNGGALAGLSVVEHGAVAKQLSCFSRIHAESSESKEAATAAQPARFGSGPGSGWPEVRAMTLLCWAGWRSLENGNRTEEG